METGLLDDRELNNKKCSERANDDEDKKESEMFNIGSGEAITVRKKYRKEYKYVFI